jgi:hypothetical protein
MINKEEVRFNNLVEILTNRADTMIPLPTGVYGYINEIRTDKFQIRLKNKVSEKEHLFSRIFESVRPIKLTEEWLINFGFEKQMEWTYKIPIKGNNFLVYYIGEKGWSIGNKNYSDFECIYVHQLQNLYFALTGLELELSSNN